MKTGWPHELEDGRLTVRGTERKGTGYRVSEGMCTVGQG